MLCFLSAGLAGAADSLLSRGAPVMQRLAVDVVAGGTGVVIGFAVCHRIILRGELGNMLQGASSVPLTVRNWLLRVRDGELSA